MPPWQLKASSKRTRNRTTINSRQRLLDDIQFEINLQCKPRNQIDTKRFSEYRIARPFAEFTFHRCTRLFAAVFSHRRGPRISTRPIYPHAPRAQPAIKQIPLYACKFARFRDVVYGSRIGYSVNLGYLVVRGTKGGGIEIAMT